MSNKQNESQFHIDDQQGVEGNFNRNSTGNTQNKNSNTMSSDGSQLKGNQEGKHFTTKDEAAALEKGESKQYGTSAARHL
ncbi:uncharacterized protein BX663DRAFT_525241 [Cokeromyces recurvatus]|uniref:uncharacterized protein n=1 Tax=Cokeromyces recurvatus TaxID=90255 RepID=UPI00221F0CDB|nr:uncharacterized protein BX663DRAFT_525241 [Cokeromyces recurvatus]KAI7898421.1 hypothetical protein BX663DRAFT_525241 [Cokeromyces recurvatus]